MLPGVLVLAAGVSGVTLLTPGKTSSTSGPFHHALPALAAPVVTSTTLSTSAPSPAAQGTPITLTATVTPATAAGKVQFKDGSANLGAPVSVSNGTAAATVSTLTVGIHLLTAVFTPDNPAAYGPSTSPAVPFTISGPTSTSAVLSTSAASPVTQGTAVTLTATLTPTSAIGMVQFKDGSTNLGDPVAVDNGTASTTTSTLAVGSHQLTAVFTSTNAMLYGPSTSPAVPFTISGATATSTTLNASSTATPVVVGSTVTLTATVNPNTAAGTVQFRDGATNIGPAVAVSNGTAATTTTTLTAGSHQLTAVFTPTNATLYSPSTSSVVTFVISGATATATTLMATPTSPTVQGTETTLTATVTPNTAVGTVQFRDGDANLGPAVTLANGTATRTTSSLSPGTHNLTAVFTPTTVTSYGPSTSRAVRYVVNQRSLVAAGAAVVPGSPNPPVDPGRSPDPVPPPPPGQSPTSPRLGLPMVLTARLVPATATGTVQFLDDTTPVGTPVPVIDGTATLLTSTLFPNPHVVRAVFTPAPTTVNRVTPQSPSLTVIGVIGGTLVDQLTLALQHLVEGITRAQHP